MTMEHGRCFICSKYFMNLFSLIDALLNPQIGIEQIGNFISLGVGHGSKLIFDKVINGENVNLFCLLIALDIFSVNRNKRARESSWFDPNPRDHIELEVPAASVSDHDSGSENADIPTPTTDNETYSELEGDDAGMLVIISEPYQMCPAFMQYCSQAMQTSVPGFDPFPRTYRKAMKDKRHWKHAAYTEFAIMHEKSVSRFPRKQNLLPGRKIIGIVDGFSKLKTMEHIVL